LNSLCSIAYLFPILSTHCKELIENMFLNLGQTLMNFTHDKDVNEERVVIYLNAVMVSHYNKHRN